VSPAPQIDETTPLTTSEVRDLQARLKALGFDPGDIDGILGPQTVTAIRRFEASRSLTPTGNVDRRTLQRLKEAGPSR
jgi:peptidoglycan hydrolase-like protein with peptidoglycan-binding domain